MGSIRHRTRNQRRIIHGPRDHARRAPNEPDNEQPPVQHQR